MLQEPGFTCGRVVLALPDSSCERGIHFSAAAGIVAGRRITEERPRLV